MLAIDGGMLSLNDIVNFPNRFRDDIPNSLDMLRDEQQMVGIDVCTFDEAPLQRLDCAGKE